MACSRVCSNEPSAVGPARLPAIRGASAEGRQRIPRHFRGSVEFPTPMVGRLPGPAGTLHAGGLRRVKVLGTAVGTHDGMARLRRDPRATGRHAPSTTRSGDVGSALTDPNGGSSAMKVMCVLDTIGWRGLASLIEGHMRLWASELGEVVLLRDTNLVGDAVPPEGVLDRPIPLQGMAAVKGIARVVSETGPDVVTTIYPRSGFWTSRALRAFPEIARVHNQHITTDDLTWTQRMVLGPIIRSSDKIITVSGAVMSDVMGRYCVQEERFTVVYNSVTPADRITPKERTEVRSRFGIPADSVLITNVARVIETKGQDVLITAFATVRRDHPNTHLMIVGPQKDRRYLNSLLRHIDVEGLTECVHLVGSQPGPESIAASDLFALSSRREGFGIVLVEAALAGVPTVTTDAGGAPEVVLDGETGLVVPVDSAPAMAEALSALLCDPDRAQALASAARERALAVFSPDGGARQYWRVFEQAYESRSVA